MGGLSQGTPQMPSTTIHVLYENPAWLPPLEEALRAEELSYRLVEVDTGAIDPAVAPPEGIWVNRISPSSHTRSHGGTIPLGRELLYWLELHGRRIINGLDAFELEMSKLRQDLVLRKHGILTPRTALAVGVENLVELARTFEGPFITKHNQGGKGLGIRLCRSAEELEALLADGTFDLGPDGKIILQQYIEAPEPFITRVEIVGGRFLFAMRSSTADGFELCPSDACQLDAQPDVCPVDGGAKFSPSPLTEDDPLVRQLCAMSLAEGIEVAGIEFVEDAEGNRYVYDINGTTNYNSVLGAEIGVDGMREVARYLRNVVVPQVNATK